MATFVYFPVPESCVKIDSPPYSLLLSALSIVIHVDLLLMSLSLTFTLPDTSRRGESEWKEEKRARLRAIARDTKKGEEQERREKEERGGIDQNEGSCRALNMECGTELQTLPTTHPHTPLRNTIIICVIFVCACVCIYCIVCAFI